jgi:hypothetical protein
MIRITLKESRNQQRENQDLQLIRINLAREAEEDKDE